MSDIADEYPRAVAYLQNQAAIYQKRMAYARGLMAPPGPRSAVQAAWSPLRPDPGNPVLSQRNATPIPITPPTSAATFSGHGPPGIIPGATTGATYLDLDTGNLYRLDP